MDSTNSLIKRSLNLEDIPKATLLSEEAGWNQTARDWRLMLTYGEGFGFETPEKRLVATAFTLPHGNRVAWISMVLVTKEFQKRGLATHLLQTCIESLTNRSISPLLDATDTGRPIYEKLGFQPLYGIHRLIRKTDRIAPSVHTDQPLNASIHRITESGLSQIVEFDREIFGADRAVVLRHLRERQPSRAISTLKNNDSIQGFLMAREGTQALQIGPIVARDADTAITLARHVLENIREPVYIDGLDRHDVFLSWLKGKGFVPQRQFTRMILGQIPQFGQPNSIFAVAGPELG